MECVNCGEPMADSATYCPRCGMAVSPSPSGAPLSGDVGNEGNALELRERAAGIGMPGSQEASEGDGPAAGDFSRARSARSRWGVASQGPGDSLGSDFSDWGEGVSSGFSKETQAEIDAGTNLAPPPPGPSIEDEDDGEDDPLTAGRGNNAFYGKELTIPTILATAVTLGPIVGYMAMMIMTILVHSRGDFEGDTMAIAIFCGAGALLVFLAGMWLRHVMHEDQKPDDPLHPYG